MTARMANAGMAVPLWIVAVLVVVAFLKLAASLVIPIVVGVLISHALEPAVRWLVRLGAPRSLAATIVVAMTLGAVGYGAYSQRANVAGALQTLPEALGELQALARKQLEPAGLEHVVDGVPQGDAVARAATSVLALGGHALVVIALVYFLLLAGQRLGHRLMEIAGPNEDDRARMAAIIEDVNGQIQRFLFVQLVTATIVGVATWGALRWQGMENAAVWAALAGAFNSIPYFGPIVVSAGLFVVQTVQTGDPAAGVPVAGLALLITSLEGWLLTPTLMGRAERMNILAVFLGLLLWTWIWGAWGTLLAVPMLSVVKAVADRVPTLHRVGRLMAS